MVSISHRGHLGSFRYLTTLMVLNDLVGQGWRVQYRQRSVFLSRPDYSRGSTAQLDPAIVKSQIRESMQEERLAKLCTPATERFIRQLERAHPKRKTIAELIRDGAELAGSLQRLPSPASVADLRTVVSPYLQLAEGETRDEHTGIRLIDIWRYFRYLWAIPYLATPGRNLFYLVRDSARPLHPVIGIAALGNSVVQLAERDRFIGWSVDGLVNRLERRSHRVRRNIDGNPPGLTGEGIEHLEPEDEYRLRVEKEAGSIKDCLLQAVRDELQLLSLKNLAESNELDRPTPALIERLLTIAGESEHERRELLRQHAETGHKLKRTEALRAWAKDSESPLYRRKRAQVLADLLYARREFEAAELATEPLLGLQRLLDTDNGRKALRIALHANKKTRIGSSMMDIIVCGAIPPYGEILGGKLVAMLIASPQVLRDYQRRYGNHASEITSRLAGRPIVRPADLVFLGTTSLYHVGSSQYERIKIPAPGGTTAYERIGYTEGYGSTSLSGETVAVLSKLVFRSEGMRRVNNVFGEGVSPRLRMIRDGLAQIGIPQDVVLRHSCPRIIYGVSLATNSLAYLRGETSIPQYYFRTNEYERETREIVDHWLRRWLSRRSKRPESSPKLNSFSKQDVLLSNEIPASNALVKIRNGGNGKCQLLLTSCPVCITDIAVMRTD